MDPVCSEQDRRVGVSGVKECQEISDQLHLAKRQRDPRDRLFLVPSAGTAVPIGRRRER